MKSLRTQLSVLLILVAIAWAVELVDLLLLHRTLDRFGIRPRTASGLWGIAIAPFLHGGLAHLAANTAPFVTLGWLTMLRGMGEFVVVSIICLLVGGAGVWLFAPAGTVHVGASGIVFGYLGYLLLRGYFERSAGAIALSIVVGLVYGGALWGVLPARYGISWQGHLFGFLGGVLAARLLARNR